MFPIDNVIMIDWQLIESRCVVNSLNLYNTRDFIENSVYITVAS